MSLGPDPAGGFRLTGITLDVSGDVDGLDADGFQTAAETAKASCPVSKALAGVDITPQRHPASDGDVGAAATRALSDPRDRGERR